MVIKLRLENTKEVFHDTVVIAVSFSGHALPDAFVFEHLLVDPHLILPALVRMQDQLAVVRDFLEGIFEHFSDLTKTRTLR